MAPPGETERLVFATWTDADADAAWSLWGDARVTRLIAAVPWTREQVDARLATEMGMQLEHGVSYWPMFLRADRSELVGCCGLRPYCGGAAGGVEPVFELGFHVRPEHWRRGFAAEAARATIQHAWSVLGARALVAGHNPANAPSGALLGKLGFSRVADEHYAPTGLMHPTYVLERPGKE